MYRTIVLIAFSSALFALGCKEWRMGDACVYARVDGREITAAMISNRVMVAARFLELSKRPVAKRTFARWANSRAAKILPSIISADVLEHEVRKLGIRLAPEHDATVLAKYNKRAKLQAGTIDEFVKEFAEEKETLKGMIERDRLFEAFYASDPKYNVTGEDVAAYLSAVSNQVEELSKYNESVCRKGKSIRQKLSDGSAWDAVAAEYSEDKLEGGDNEGYCREWETFIPKDFYLKEVGNAVASLKKGDITEPLDTDEGLLIVRVNDVQGDLYTCSRILLRMALVPPIPSAKEARERIRMDRCVEMQKKVLARAWKNLKIEYPMGTNFTMRIWPVPERKGNRLKRTKKNVPVQTQP